MRFKASLGLLVALAVVQLPSAGASADVSMSVAVDTAIAHVRANATSFEVSTADVADLLVTDSYRSEHNGVTHVYLRQRLNKLQVWESNATVGVLPNGRVFHVAARLIPGLAEGASGSIQLSAGEAYAAAARELGAVAPRQTAAPKIVYQPSAGALRLAWNLEMEARDSWWNVSVDAETGKILWSYDYVIRHEFDAPAGAEAAQDGVRKLVQPEHAFGPGTDGATYRVLALPVASPNDGPATLVTNPSLPSASPYGWHDTDGLPGAESTLTQGNNVNAAWDPVSDPLGVVNTGQLVPAFHAEGGSSLTFDYTFDHALPPQTYKDAAVTNLFYWNNLIHDVFYGYGFDERSGNFQENNYGKWPIGAGDSVNADAQDGGGVNNANFGTPPDGQNPRMQMYVWQNGRQLRDGDLDGEIIVHEYGHGISNRLTGGPTNVSCLRNSEQAGEGWSDYLALAMTVQPGDNGSMPRGLATYSVAQTSRAGTGIRPTRYKQGATTPTYNSIKSAAVPHGVGWVWAHMLWDLHWNLADKYGFNPDVYGAWNTGGNNRANQLVMDGMKLQACSPGFADSRDGILAADVALTGGADRCTIWATFARRGLGFSASQGSSGSVTDGTQAFDVPPDCV